MTRFDKFLNDQEEKKIKFEPEKRIEEFRRRVEDLYQTIDKWIEKYLGNKILTGTIETEITEEQLGTYKMPDKWFHIGNSRVIMHPVGTYMIGTPARIDMKCGAQKVMIVLLGTNITHFSQMIQVLEPGQKPKKEDPGKLVWKIVNPSTRSTYKILTKEVFENLLMSLIDG